MTHYKLIYFNVKGRAEAARIIFALAGVPFEDHRVTLEEWISIKQTMPMGQIPVLEVDGKKLCQSMAICRYLANKFGFSGKTPWESARCDMIADSVNDIWTIFIPWFQEKDKQKKVCPENVPQRSQPLCIFALFLKQELLDSIITEHLTCFLDKINILLVENGTGYFVGDELTWADIVIFTAIDWWKAWCGKFLENYPKLLEHWQVIGEVPRIKSWIKARPHSLI